ncbi:MAG: right-handed parallel beta-helix repeat-containing protein [Pseudomonadota bacterium]
MQAQAQKSKVSKQIQKYAKRFLMTTAMTAVGLSSVGNSAKAADDWTGHTLAPGSAGSISYDPNAPANTTKITQTGQRVTVNGDGDLQAGWTVDIAQDNVNAQYILFDVEGDETQIFGNINANGQLWILNQNGVFFGAGSRIDVNSLVASTAGSLSFTDIDGGEQAVFSNFGTGSVTNEGEIFVGLSSMTAEQAGLAAFVSPFARNSGVINARMSTVAMAAGNMVTLDLYNDGLFEIAVDGELADGLLENSGDIKAFGGNVVVTAEVAKQATESVINMGGLVNASSAQVKGGKIILSGGSKGKVNVTGNVYANGRSGEQGGEVEISGQAVEIAETGRVFARSNLDGLATAGSITLSALADLTINGRVSAIGEGDTGSTTLIADDINIGTNAVIEAGMAAIRRSTLGSIGLGSATGTDMSLSQDELANIDAATLTIGGDNTTDLIVEAIDTTTNTIRNLVTMISTRDMSFSGTNVFAALSATAGDDLVVNNGASITTTEGGVSLTANNTDGAGLSVLQIEGTIDTTAAGAAGTVDLNSTDYFIEIDKTGSVITNGGKLTATSNHGFDIDKDGTVSLGTGDAEINAPKVQLGDDIQTTGTVSGNAAEVDVENPNTEIQDGVDIAAAGAIVNIGAGTFTQSTNINKALNILGAGKTDTTITPTSGNGFTIDGAIDGDIAIKDLAIDGAQNGIIVERTTTGLNFLDLAGLDISNSGNAGVAVFGQTANRTWITNSEFTDNGSLATTNRGQGDILFYLYDGDIRLKDVTVEGNTPDVDYGGSTGVAPTADYGIQIIGSNPRESWSPEIGPSGSIEFDNVKVSGNYRAAQIGIQEYDGIGPVTFKDVVLGGQTTDGTDSSGWASLYLSNLGAGDIDLGNTVFNGGPAGYNYIWNITGGDVDATNVTFTDAADNFDIEDRIIHKQDDPTALFFGLVTWVANSLFVTENTGVVDPTTGNFIRTGIQHAVDIASSGNDIFVDDGTYNESVNVYKTVQLYGNNHAVPGSGSRLAETIVTGNSPAYNVTANNVVISGFELNGGPSGSLTYGVYLDDVRGTTISNNIISNSSIAGIGGIVDHQPTPGTITIANNFIDGSNTGDGIALKGDSAAKDDTNSLVGVDIDIKDNQIGEAGDRIGGKGISFGKVGDADGSIEAAGTTNVKSNIEISGNDIYAGNDGVEFDGSVSDATINIDNNKNIISGGSSNFSDAVDFRGVISDSTISITGNELIEGKDDAIQVIGGIVNSNFTVESNKIESLNGEAITLLSYSSFGGDDLNSVSEGSVVTIAKNEIISNGPDGDTDNIGGNSNGVHFSGNVDGSTVDINNNTINAYGDGVKFNGKILSSTVDIQDNDRIKGQNDDGIDFNADIEGKSKVTIAGNDLIVGGSSNAVEFNKIEDGSTVTIETNEMNADDNGIYASNILTGATLNVYSNFIKANRDNGSYGSGILVKQKVEGATVNIGKGGYLSSPSNFITVEDNTDTTDNSEVDGIRFAGGVGQGADINIDGNRIGYTGIPGIHSSAKRVFVAGDAIEINGIDGNADVDITDNHIAADANGVNVSGNVEGTSNTLIGGKNDTNIIAAKENGIVFASDVSGESEIEISYNDVRANGDGLLFSGNTSNAVQPSTTTGEEIYILKNDILAGQNGVSFTGQAFNSRHDIKIEDNDIEGRGGHGISHTGGINDQANLKIVDNNKVQGSQDGIHVVGSFRNGARIDITGNDNVRGVYDDGINVWDTGFDTGSVTKIIDNHVHYTGDDGIFVRNVENALIEDNEIHNTDGDGIHGYNVDRADIIDNDIWNTDENGIKIEEGSDFVDITENDIDEAEFDGINVVGGSAAWIWDNEIDDSGFDGIDVTSNSKVKIWDNEIDGAGDNGIEVANSFAAKILTNDITDVDNDGINVDKSDYAYIYQNDIYGQATASTRSRSSSKQGAGRDGIHVSDSDFVDIKENNITGDSAFRRKDGLGAGRHGIFVDGGRYADIEWNVIQGENTFFHSADSVGQDGIRVEDNYKADIFDNIVKDTGDDGIYVDDSNFVEIHRNTVKDAGDDGIDVNDSYAAHIQYNIVKGTEDNGITVFDSRYADVKNNIVTSAGENGISVSDSDDADIFENIVTLSGDNGIRASRSDDLEIARNVVSLSGDDGIDVNSSDDIKIYNNISGLNGEDGIDVEGGQDISIYENLTTLNRQSGIDVDGSYNITVNNNKSFFNGQNGIEIDATYYGKKEGPNTINIVENITNENGQNGIFVSGDSRFGGIELTVDTNETNDNGDDGINIVSFGSFSNGESTIETAQSVFLLELDESSREGERLIERRRQPGEFNSTIINNIVEGNENNGLYMEGGFHNNIEVSDNEFNGNDIGANFESGTIDLTNEGNEFSESRVAMRFAPAQIGVEFPEFDEGEFSDETAFIVSPFEVEGTPIFADMSLVGNTIGAQTFDIVEEAYVELDNGAFFDPGAPTQLSMLDSTFLNTPFGNFTPNVDFSDGFTPDVVSFLEERFFHFVDDTTLGEFFFPLFNEIDNADVFRAIEAQNARVSGLNVTLIGFPSATAEETPISVAASAPTDNVGTIFNALEPEAGGETESDAENLNNLEPGAGGTDVACWSDAVSAAAQGPVNFSYSGDALDLLDAEANCGTDI